MTKKDFYKTEKAFLDNFSLDFDNLAKKLEKIKSFSI